MTMLHTSRRFQLLTLALGFALSSFLSTSASAQSPTIVRVEEDWELVVGTPDQNSVAPQVTCMFSPTGSSTSLCGAFELNHRSQPGFAAGGLQLQLWDGGIPLESKDSQCDCTISEDNETVTWTQSMTLTGGVFVLEIHNGNSATWGSFGDTGHLKTVSSSTLVNLNGYNPEFSVDNSGVGYAANRVQTLVLKRVRLITDTGEVLEDTTLRTVFSQN